jgi:hypothetical protein
MIPGKPAFLVASGSPRPLEAPAREGLPGDKRRDSVRSRAARPGSVLPAILPVGIWQAVLRMIIIAAIKAPSDFPRNLRPDFLQ